MLLGYSVTICTADQLKIQRGRFFISNTDTSQGPGEHWVAFYFPKRGPFEFFDSLGHMAKGYGVGFEKILKRKYLKNVCQLQQSTSNVCGLNCTYYVMKRHQGKTMRDIVKDFNVQQKKQNDRLIVTKTQSVKASYAQSVRSLPSSLTEAFSALPRFVSGKDRNKMRKKTPKVSSMQKNIKIHNLTAV